MGSSPKTIGRREPNVGSTPGLSGLADDDSEDISDASADGHDPENAGSAWGHSWCPLTRICINSNESSTSTTFFSGYRINTLPTHGMEQKSAHIIGGGLAGLAVAAFLFDDAQMPAERVTVYESREVLGGA